MKTQRGGPTAAALRGRLRNITLWLLGPSAALVPIALVYLRADGLPHVFVHTLAGWNTGLLLLLAAAHRGRPPSRRDGLLPLALALYALAPDLMYSVGPAHRDWMDVFLFHVALDEILPYALPVLSALWAVQWVALLAVSRRPGAPAGAPAVARGAPPPRTGSRQFAFLLLGVGAALAATVAAGLVAERTASTPLVRVG